jgi:hypothetical protein
MSAQQGQLDRERRAREARKNQNHTKSGNSHKGKGGEDPEANRQNALRRQKPPVQVALDEAQEAIPAVQPVIELPVRKIDKYKSVTLFTKEVSAPAIPEVEEYTLVKVCGCFFRMLVVVCVCGGSFLVGGPLAVIVSLAVLIYMRRTKELEPTRRVANTGDFDLFFQETSIYDNGNVACLGEHAVEIVVNGRMLDDLHRQGRNCDYSKGDVWGRCNSILGSSHGTRAYTLQNGENMSEEELTAFSSDAISYFLQSLVVARSRNRNAAVTRDNFRDLLSN